VLVKNSKAHHRGPCLQAQMKNLEKEIEKLKGKIRGKQKKIRSLDRKWEKNTYRLRHQLEHMKKDIRKQVTKTAMVKFRRVVRMDKMTEISYLIKVDLEELVPE
jgi:predicted  nucleic acid-binding Zn-ribbon protein